MAHRAAGRCIVVAVAVDALAHLEWFHLLNLCHGCNVTVAGGAGARRTFGHTAGRARHNFRGLREKSNVRLVDEPDAVWKAVDSLPVNRLWTIVANDIRSISQDCELGIVGSANHLVAGRTEAYRRDAGVCLCGHGPVTERAIEPKAFQWRTVGGHAVELIRRGVNSVRKVDRLVEGLFKSKDRDRLTEPSCNDERRYNTHDCHDTEATDGQHRHEQLW